MKKIMQFGAGMVLMLTIFSCSNGQESTQATGVYEDVNVEQFSKHMEGAQLLDVRTPQEWSEGVIEGATMYNFYDADFKDRIAKLNKDVPVAVYCKSGGRSGQTGAMLRDMGFKEVYNLKGGIGAWNAAGKPTVKP